MKAEDLVREIERKLGKVHGGTGRRQRRPHRKRRGRHRARGGSLPRRLSGKRWSSRTAAAGLSWNLDEDFASVLVLAENTDLAEGSEVKSTGRPLPFLFSEEPPGPGHRPVRHAA